MTTREIVDKLMDLGRLSVLLKGEWRIVDSSDGDVDTGEGSIASHVPQLVEAEIDRLTAELERRTGEAR